MAASLSHLQVRRLSMADLPALQALRSRALREHPVSFSSSPDQDRVQDAQRMQPSLSGLEESAVFGGFAELALVGMAGVVREDSRKLRHSALIWGMYVAPEARRGGLGRALMNAALAQARAWPGVVNVHLAVSIAAPQARAMYDQLGFRAWGTQPRAIFHDGAFHDEVHMVLDID
jgi:RimJ/RimL family protein N-acetyltransferase